MSARCFYLRRRFVTYLEGGLSPRRRENLERHLAGCRECGELLERVRTGHEAGRQFGRLGAADGPRPPEFEEIWARAGSRPDGRLPETFRTGRVFIRPLPAALAVLALALTIVLARSNRRAVGRADEGAGMSAAARALRDFTPLRIAAFEPNTKSPVVTEGLVRGVYFDEKEKTLHIKLVDNDEKPEPFVICEVRSPGRMDIPREGSRVRVYGMARFDPQPGRRWNEVNPVTNIDILKR